jgi:hypothetical protein
MDDAGREHYLYVDGLSLGSTLWLDVGLLVLVVGHDEARSEWKAGLMIVERAFRQERGFRTCRL